MYVTLLLCVLCSCLWFVLDSLIGKSEDYNYSFLHKLVECIKHSKDAQGPEDEEMNKKLWAVCDLTSGLLLHKVTNIKLKDCNIEPALPAKLFLKQDKVAPLPGFLDQLTVHSLLTDNSSVD